MRNRTLYVLAAILLVCIVSCSEQPADTKSIEQAMSQSEGGKKAALAMLSSQPTLSEMQAAISKFGERNVLQGIYDGWATGNDKRFLKVLEKIEKGQAPWFAVAQKLRAVSDAGVSEMLDKAMKGALANSPDVVLSAYGNDSDTANGYCTDLTALIMDRKAALQHLSKLEVALARMNVAALQTRRDICLAQVQRQVTELKNQKNDNSRRAP